MATDIFDECEDRAQSIYALSKYMPYSNRWSRIAKEIPKLAQEGTKAIQLDGRLDILSYQIYGSAFYDWILAIYNHVTYIGSDEPKELRKTINLTLEADEQEDFMLSIRHADVLVGYNGVNKTIYQDGDGNSYVDLDGDTQADIRIYYDISNGAIRIKNVNISTTFTFEVSYIERTTDAYMMTGTVLKYPSQADIQSLLESILAEETDDSKLSFERL